MYFLIYDIKNFYFYLADTFLKNVGQGLILADIAEIADRFSSTVYKGAEYENLKYELRKM